MEVKFALQISPSFSCFIHRCSSVGRALVSKTRCREFEPLHLCTKDKIMASVFNYVVESYDELTRKVTWPSWGELQSQSVLVLIASLIISGLIFIMDFSFGVNSEGMWWEGVLGNLYRYVLN